MLSDILVRKNMRINELKLKDIHVGMRVRSLCSDRQGTIVEINHADDDYAWIQWDGDDKPYGGFYGNNCQCEVVE